MLFHLNLLNKIAIQNYIEHRSIKIFKCNHFSSNNNNSCEICMCDEIKYSSILNEILYENNNYIKCYNYNYYHFKDNFVEFFGLCDKSGKNFSGLSYYNDKVEDITYFGNFRNNLKNGYGCLKKKDKMYIGYWKSDQLNFGQILTEKMLIISTFKNYIPNGFSCIVRGNQLTCGNIKNGNFVGTVEVKNDYFNFNFYVEPKFGIIKDIKIQKIKQEVKEIKKYNYYLYSSTNYHDNYNMGIEFKNYIPTYVGEFMNFKKNGYGIEYSEYSSEKWKYMGKWKNNKYNGYGVFKFHNGREYRGEFKNSRRDGKGVLYDSFGKIIYDGEWRLSKKHGNGVIYGKNYIFKGRCKDNKKYYGEIIFKSHRFYGKFKDNNIYSGIINIKKFTTIVIHCWSNENFYNWVNIYDLKENSIYVGYVDKKLNKSNVGYFYKYNCLLYFGEFKNNFYNGQGEEYMNGEKYNGQFLNGKKHGYGHLYNYDLEKFYYVEYKNDELISLDIVEK